MTPAGGETGSAALTAPPRPARCDLMSDTEGRAGVGTAGLMWGQLDSSLTHVGHDLYIVAVRFSCYH